MAAAKVAPESVASLPAYVSAKAAASVSAAARSASMPGLSGLS